MAGSVQTESAAEASTNKQKDGNASGSSEGPSSAITAGAAEYSAATISNLEFGPCSTVNSTTRFSPTAGCTTTSQSSTISLPSSTQNPSISLPLPMPPGVPAGGIFKQAAAQFTSAGVGVVSLDPIAVDLSPSNIAPAGSSGLAAAMHGGQSALLVAQGATTTLRLSALQFSPGSSLASHPVEALIETAARPDRQRAELPDVAALAPEDLPEFPVSDAGGYADPKPLDDSMMELALTAQRPVALKLSASVTGHSDPDESETQRKEHRLRAHLAIYSAVSLTVGVSAPGLTSVISRGKGRDRRRVNVAPGGRAPGSPR
jgi:hypothetical protein